jgi:hypothetical protein
MSSGTTPCVPHTIAFTYTLDETAPPTSSRLGDKEVRIITPKAPFTFLGLNESQFETALGVYGLVAISIFASMVVALAIPEITCAMLIGVLVYVTVITISMIWAFTHPYKEEIR